MKTTLSKIIGSALFTTSVAVSLVAAPAQAGSLGTCSTTNVSLGGVDSTACAGGFDGNDTGAGGTLLGKLSGTPETKGLFSSSFSSNQQVTWSLAAKSDENNLFGFDAKEDSNKGTWGFTKALSTNTFVMSLKSSTGYSAYLFKDYDWKKGLTGLFDTIGVSLNSNNGKAQALSHASLFAANVTTVTPPANTTPVTPPANTTPTNPPANTTPTNPPTNTTPVIPDIKVVAPPAAEVPEPATIVGLGLAFGGMLSVRRRQNH